MAPAAADSTDRGRLFVALDFDDAARSALVSWRAEIVSEVPGVRPVAVSVNIAGVAGSVWVTRLFKKFASVARSR